MLPQIPVRRPEHLETTSLGAAFAAGIAMGFWTKEWVLGSTSDERQHGEVTDFLPKVCWICRAPPACQSTALWERMRGGSVAGSMRLP